MYIYNVTKKASLQNWQPTHKQTDRLADKETHKQTNKPTHTYIFGKRLFDLIINEQRKWRNLTIDFWPRFKALLNQRLRQQICEFSDFSISTIFLIFSDNGIVFSENFYIGYICLDFFDPPFFVFYMIFKKLDQKICGKVSKFRNCMEAAM